MTHQFSLRLALVLLCTTMAGVLCLGGAGRAVQTNLAYLDLMHGLPDFPESQGERAERFKAWAATPGSSVTDDSAVVYGSKERAVMTRT